MEWRDHGNDILGKVNSIGQVDFATPTYSTGGYDVLVKNQTTGLHEMVSASSLIGSSSIVNSTSLQIGAQFNIGGLGKANQFLANQYRFTDQDNSSFEGLISYASGTWNFQGPGWSTFLDVSQNTGNRTIIAPDEDGHLPLSDLPFRIIGTEIGSDSSPYLHIVHDGTDYWMPLMSSLP